MYKLKHGVPSLLAKKHGVSRQTVYNVLWGKTNNEAILNDIKKYQLQHKNTTEQMIEAERQLNELYK